MVTAAGSIIDHLPLCTEGNKGTQSAGTHGASTSTSFNLFSAMANSLSVTAKILPLISVAIKLVDGVNVVDRTVPARREAAEGLKILGDDLKGLEKLIIQINANLGGLVNKSKDRGFKKLFRE